MIRVYHSIYNDLPVDHIMHIVSPFYLFLPVDGPFVRVHSLPVPTIPCGLGKLGRPLLIGVSTQMVCGTEIVTLRCETFNHIGVA